MDIKLWKLWSRHRKKLVRNEYKLMNGSQPCSTRVTRNSRTTGQNWDKPWRGIDKRDLGYMLTMKAYKYKHCEDKKLYDRTEPGHLKFDEKSVREWVRVNNTKISEIARKRFLGIWE